MKTAFLFPGQGSQYPGMARDLFDASAAVRQLFTLASDTTGLDAQRLLFEGSEEELKETINTQVAVTLANLASATVLAERGITPDGVAGFSLGEYSALVTSGMLTAEQVFPLVKRRGEAMTQACERLDRSAGDPGMAAIIGLPPEKIDEVLAAAAIKDLFGANYNSPTQTVISGTAAGLAAGIEALKAAGARRAIVLKVSGPFHSPLLAEAARELEADLNKLTFAEPRIPLFSNVTAGVVTTAAEAKALAVRHMTSPVLWTREEKTILDAGYQRLFEVGPGAVLTGLWGAFDTTLTVVPAGKLEQISQIG